MKDVQNLEDTRGIPIDRVGVSDLRYPIVVLDQENQKQHSIANIALSVDLPHQFKGTHMSRFVEVLSRHHGDMTMRVIPTILAELKERLEAERTHIDVSFPYFLAKKAPVTQSEGLVDYDCCFSGEMSSSDSHFTLEVTVPVTSLCPCSKEISSYGAHNQRSRVSIAVKTRKKPDGTWDFVWIEELIRVAEQSASSPLYSLLKRPDEKFVTEQAYDNPVFVEDLVRGVATELMDDERVVWFCVRSVNEESIHNHNAFAEVSWSR
jgi:GTP cyclohydrolase I